MDVFWLEATPWNPAAAAAVTVRACSVDLGPIVTFGGNEWLPLLGGGPVLDTNVFNGTFAGRAGTTHGEIELYAGLGEIDAWGSYDWPNRRVQIWHGVIDTSNPANPTYPTTRNLIFDGEAVSFDPDEALLALTVKQPVGLIANGTYAGTGLEQGTSSLIGVRRPFAAGRHRNRPARLIDAGKMRFQVHGYGAISALTRVRERGIVLDQPFTFHTTSSALDAAVVPPEQIHVHLGSGSFRLGFTPAGEISADFDGDMLGGTYSGRTGKIIQRLLGIVGWTGAIDTASLDYLDTQIPHDIAFSDTNGTDIQAALSELMGSCGGYWDVDEFGTFYVGLFQKRTEHDFSLGDETAAQADYDILAVDHLPVRAPFWRNRMGYERNPLVLDFGDTDALAGLEELERALADAASDNIIDPGEKSEVLIPRNAELETRYAQTRSRAIAAGVAVTALDAVRANWAALLASYSPRWNDLVASTDIYTAAFPDEYFPDGWTLGSNITTAPNGVYTTVTESGGSSRNAITRAQPQAAAARQYSCAAIIKKDAIPATTRFVDLSMQATGGTVKTATVGIETSTGRVGNGVNTDAYGSLDLGDEWLVWMTFTTNADNTGVTVRLFPASGQNTNLTTTNTATTGSVDVRPLLFVLGDWKKLGRAMLTGRMSGYNGELSATLRAISERDATTGLVIATQPDTIIRANSDGTIKSGELPRNVGFSASVGTANVTSVTAWSRTAPAGITCTIGASTGVLNITGLTVAEAEVTITGTYNGVTRTIRHRVRRENDPPTSTGGSGSTSATTTTLGATTGAAYDATNAVSATLTVQAPASGNIKCTAPVDFVRSGSTSGVTGAFGKWQWRAVGGTWADIATEVADGGDASTTIEQDVETGQTFEIDYPGVLSVVHTKTGLTSGTNYEFRFLWRRVDVSGTAANVYRAGGTLKAEQA